MKSEVEKDLPRFAELDAEYEILQELGRGGTAVVYLARERELGRRVAIKLMQRDRPSFTERFIVEAKARRAECLVFEGRYAEALEVAEECREAAAMSPVGGLEALIERSIGYALCQARRPAEAVSHFDDSLRFAREQKAQYELALTLRALALTKQPNAEQARAESDAILAGLGVVTLPAVPLP